ncbi:hypothetical protein BDW22DRAFT_1337809 [Trametopsis cervina]|nr:hypothetical protein BDW22DRAFT_1337809 [Trametopsis cervina]
MKDSEEITDVIDFPCVVTDNQNKVLCWYFPEVLDAEAQVSAHAFAEILLTPPQEPSNRAGVSWRVDAQYFRKPEDCEVPPGAITFAPVWHESGKPHSKYPPAVGAAWRDFQSTPEFQAWSDGMTALRDMFVTTAAICHPIQLMQTYNCETRLTETEAFASAVRTWNYPSHGLAFISNRQTPLHRDRKTSTTMYDTLVTCGRYSDGDFMIAEVGLRFRYKPGTMITLAGGLLRHGAEVEDGERVVIASFMRQELMDAMDVACSALADVKDLALDAYEWLKVMEGVLSGKPADQ